MQNLNENTLRRFLLLTLTAFAGAALFYCLFRYLLPWCLPFLLAFLIASLLEPLVLHLQRRLRFQRSFSALILTLTLLFLLGGLLSLLWSTLLAQMSALLSAAPAFFDAIPAAANDLLSRLERFSAASPEWFSRFLHEQFLQVITDADSLLRALSERAVGALTAAAATLPGSVLAVATCVLALFFTSASYPELCSALERSIPQIAMQKLLRLRDGVMRSLARWLRAQAGLPSVASLFAMYLGYCTFGIAGMVLFPFFLLLLSQIRNTRPEKA